MDQLLKFQQGLEEAWKGMRWTMDIITYSRDKNVRGGVPLGILYAPPPSPNDSPQMERKDVDNGQTSKNEDNNNVESHKSKGKGMPVMSPNRPQPGILRVYAAYETGLAKGTSVKLHVTPRTTSREVINLVVQQLNKAVRMKRCCGPVYEDENLLDFCLVAVIGARERVLRDDYQPLQLQNPWTKGRLFVRLRHNLLAAIEQDQATGTVV